MSDRSVLEVDGLPAPGPSAGWELPDETVSVIVAHDDAVMRDTLRGELEGTSRYRVVAEAGTGAEAMSLINALRPAVAVVDLHMDGLDGLAALPALRGCSPSTRILVYAEHSSFVTSRAAVTLGAAGVVTGGSALGFLTSPAA